MNIWRLHLRNSIEANLTQKDLFDLCLKDQIIGVGWTSISVRTEDSRLIHKQAHEFYSGSNAVAGYKAINAMRKMQVDDLIWTWYNGDYYLCKVNGRWIDQPYKEEYIPYDITSYVPVTWQKIGMQDLVAGKIKASFRPAATLQHIYGMNDYSAYVWNQYHKNQDYAVKKPEVSVWNLLDSENIEELVLLYLQVEKLCYIYTASMKHATRKYECRMVNASGQYVFPQIKSGEVGLNANDYMQALVENPDAKVYLFSAAENYTKNDDKRFVYLTRQEIETFARKHENLIPKVTHAWFDMCGFWK